MNTNKQTTLEQLKMLIDSQNFAVLSTQKNGQPYANLMAFAVTENFDQIIFLTSNTTRKYDNLTSNPRAAILINNSQNLADDTKTATSVTATGITTTINNDDRKTLEALYLKKHPHMKDFSESPTTALVSLAVESYIMVSQFENVVEIKI